MARVSLMAFATNVPHSRIVMASSSSSTMLKAGPPAQYILHYSYVPDVLEKRGPHREQHLRLAQELCLFGGPTAPVDNTAVPTGALFVFASADSASAFVEQDPYLSAGIVTEHCIEEWTMAIQN